MSMMEDTEINQTIRNIVKEILSQFESIDYHADEHLITFYVKLLLYDPNWQIEGQVLLARQNIQKLINFVVESIQLEEEPDMVTIKIQHCFLNTFRRRHQILQNRKINLNERLHLLKISILEQSNSNSEDELTKTLHKIVVYFVLLSGLGNPSITDVYKQSKAVVQSVLNKEELRQFIDTPYVLRMEMLENLVKIFTGMRIYNKDCGRGGLGVPDLSKLLFNAICGLSEFLIYITEEVTEKIKILTKAISNCHVPYVQKNKVFLKVSPPEENITEEDIEYSIHLVLVYKQFQEAIQFLLDEVTLLRNSSLNVETRFIQILDHLHASVVPNFYIHIDLVFPYFMELSSIWSTFQDSVVLLNIIRQVVQQIDKMVNSLSFDTCILVKYYAKIFPKEIVFDETNVNISLPKEDMNVDCRMYTKEDIDILSQEKGEILYEYEGHCCWMLVLTNGFLIKGNEEYGIVGYKGRFFVFSSTLALKCFIKEPNYFMDHVLHMARERTVFILYLKLQQDLIDVKQELNLIKPLLEESQTTFVEVACQVEHNVEPFIDKTYHHSLWEYKSDALKLATLSRSKTVSTMTDKTFFKNSMHSQTFFYRDKSLTTSTDKYTNTPKPLVFIRGLRNDKDAKEQEQLDLTYWDFKPNL